MKSRLKYLLSFFGVFIAVFVAMKAAFMLYNGAGQESTLGDFFCVVWHGLPLDLSTVCYLAVIPWLVCLLSLWLHGGWPRLVTKIYCCIIAPLTALILVADIVLYQFWQFKLDATVFNYLDAPGQAVASVSVLFLIVSILCVCVLAAVLILGLRFVWQRKLVSSPRRLVHTACFLLIGGIMFLAIRGGTGRSTMNVGRAYFSQNQFLNHSAVNPVFSLFSSAFKVQRFDKMYRFFTQNSCDSLFTQLQYSTKSQACDSLLRTARPNIVLIVMEGFGASFVGPLGGDPNIAPNFNKFCDEGVLFSNCYANSFRTDRGLVSTLSGYPAFPDISVMKLPEKSRCLSSLAQRLVANGYNAEFLYGGDINFTNCKSYLLSTGYNSARGYETFPSSVRHGHSWGVNDHITLDTLYNIIATQRQPSFTTCLTLSSHEDWKVPYNRLPNNPVANSMAYLDDCIGKLVARLKASPQWDNMLLILLPDHGIAYPQGITEANPERNHIPILWIGGAVRQPRTISVLCNQTDLAATLLGQLGIAHDEMTFSRDVLSQTYTYPLAVHTYAGGVSFMDSTGVSVLDLHSHKIICNQNKGADLSDRRISLAQAYLQKTMSHFADIDAIKR